MLRTLLAVVLATTFQLIFVSSSNATTYDASAEFSASSNPNGVWTYMNLQATGSGGVGLPSSFSSLLDTYGELPNFAFSGWHPSGLDFPTFGKVTEDAEKIVSHPSSDDAMLRFTVPLSGGPVSANLLISIEDGDATNAGDGSIFHIFKNDLKIGGSIVLPTFSAFTIAIDDIELAPGDTLSYVHDGGGFGSSNIFDSILFNMVVSTTPVPLPPALILFVPLAGIVFRRRIA